MPKGKFRNMWWLWVSLLVVIADAWAKVWVKKTFVLGLAYPLLPFLNLTLAYNRGAAFSFLSQEGGWQQWLFGIIAVVVIFVIFFWLATMKKNHRLQAFALALVLGGAAGNLISRLYYGYVVDFIDFHVAGWHWPAFNIADSAICIGVFFLIVDMFKKR